MPAPVSGNWHFRGNEFVVEAYRDHGVEAVIYGLWQLSERARTSFYFAPSMRLWEDYPEVVNAKPPLEIDALAVVDGMLYLCEGKSSAGLDDSEIVKLVSAAERIRPDVLLIACMEEDTRGINAQATKLKGRLPSGVDFEIIEFRPEVLERSPILPG